MTDASYTGPIPFSVARRAIAEPLCTTQPQRFRAPVFINDAVTPLGGETVLSLLMKRMAGADEPSP